MFSSGFSSLSLSRPNPSGIKSSIFMSFTKLPWLHTSCKYWKLIFRNPVCLYVHTCQTSVRLSQWKWGNFSLFINYCIWQKRKSAKPEECTAVLHVLSGSHLNGCSQGFYPQTQNLEAPCTALKNSTTGKSCSVAFIWISGYTSGFHPPNQKKEPPSIHVVY